MAPLTFAGVGWCLVVLGSTGPLGLAAGAVGLAVLLVGVGRIRWRNRALEATFWAGVVLLAGSVALFAGAPVSLPLVLLLALLQTGVAVGLATGVREGLRAGKPTDEPFAARLFLARALVGATFVLSLGATVVPGVPVTALLVLYVATLGVNLWLGVLLILLRENPSMQEQGAARA